MHPSEQAIFRNEQIPVLIEGNAVGRNYDARTPLLGLKLVAAHAGFSVSAETGDHIPRFVENGDSPLKLTDSRVITMNGHGRWQQKLPGHDAHKIPVERHVDNPTVRAVAPDDTGRLEAGIDRNLVQSAELVRLLSAAERF